MSVGWQEWGRLGESLASAKLASLAGLPYVPGSIQMQQLPLALSSGWLRDTSAAVHHTGCNCTSQTPQLRLGEVHLDVLQLKNVKLTTLVSCVGGANDIGRHISDYAEQNDADMLVMGSRGLGTARR